MGPARDYQLNVRLTPDDAERLEHHAARRDVSSQDFVRELIRMAGRWTEHERMLIVNQLEIRKALTKDKHEAEGFAQLITIVSEGFEVFYKDVASRLGVREPMPAEQGRFVLDVLQMYRALHHFTSNPKHAHAVKEDSFAWFRGFDGNDDYEGTCLAFTRFVVRVQGLYPEQNERWNETDHFNSHWPVRRHYEAMLDVWEAMPVERRYHLTIADVTRMLAAADAADTSVHADFAVQEARYARLERERSATRARAPKPNLRDDVLWTLTAESPLRPSDLVAELAQRYPGVAKEVNHILDALAVDGFVKGSPTQGYVLTAKGAAFRGA